jgi:hypothetical protein
VRHYRHNSDVRQRELERAAHSDFDAWAALVVGMKRAGSPRPLDYPQPPRVAPARLIGFLEDTGIYRDLLNDFMERWASMALTPFRPYRARQDYFGATWPGGITIAYHPSKRQWVAIRAGVRLLSTGASTHYTGAHRDDDIGRIRVLKLYETALRWPPNNPGEADKLIEFMRSTGKATPGSMTLFETRVRKWEQRRAGPEVSVSRIQVPINLLGYLSGDPDRIRALRAIAGIPVDRPHDQLSNWENNPKPKKLMLDRLLKGEKVALWHSTRPALLKQLRAKAKSATQVQANEAWRWVAVEADKSSWRIPEDFPVVAPPFQHLYVEFDNVEEFEHQDKSAWSKAGVFLSWDGDGESGWRLTGDVFLLFETMGLFHAGSVTVNVNPTGQIIPGPGSPHVALGMVPVMWISALRGKLQGGRLPPEPRKHKKGSQSSFIPHPRTFATSRTELLDIPESPEALTVDYERMVLDVFGGALMAIVFMHSKGVKLHDAKDRAPRRKKGKAKKKASKPGLIHKVLDVGLEANESLREAKASGGDARAAVRLHWRRGRFNLYGVQGRKPHVSGFVGPMWIRPHMAGRLPGEIKKQYRVRRKKNPDRELQRLRRAAAAGDPDAQEAFERYRERTFPDPEWIELEQGDTLVTLRPLTGGVIVDGGPGVSYKIPEGTFVSDPSTGRLGDIQFDWVDGEGKTRRSTVGGTKTRHPYDTGVYHTWSLKRVGPEEAQRARRIYAEAEERQHAWARARACSKGKWQGRCHRLDCPACNLRRKDERERKKRSNPSPEQTLGEAARILVSTPALLDPFLRRVGVRPTEAEKLAEAHGGYWGEHPRHLSEDWRTEVETESTRQGYWDWVVGSARVSENPPTPDRILRQAERILAADPARLAEFLEGLLYTGHLPVPLIHRIHAELMRYDLMEKLPIYELTGPGSRYGLFGDAGRALHEAAWRAHQVAVGLSRDTLAEAIQARREDGDSQGALEIFNEEFPATPIRVRGLLIE